MTCKQCGRTVLKCDCDDAGPSRIVALESRVRELEAALAASLKTIEERIPLLSRMVELEAERDRLRSLAEEAIESIEDWAGYADAYFQNKHDLQGELVRLRAALKG